MPGRSVRHAAAPAATGPGQASGLSQHDLRIGAELGQRARSDGALGTG